MLEVATEKKKDLRIQLIHLRGRMDAMTGPDFERLFDELLASEHRYFILEAAQLEYVASSGIAALLRFIHRLQSSGGGACILHPNQEVDMLIHFFGMEKNLPVFFDLEKARKYMSSHAEKIEAGWLSGPLFDPLLPPGSDARNQPATHTNQSAQEMPGSFSRSSVTDDYSVSSESGSQAAANRDSDFPDKESLADKNEEQADLKQQSIIHTEPKPLYRDRSEKPDPGVSLSDDELSDFGFSKGPQLKEDIAAMKQQKSLDPSHRHRGESSEQRTDRRSEQLRGYNSQNQNSGNRSIDNREIESLGGHLHELNYQLQSLNDRLQSLPESLSKQIHALPVRQESVSQIDKSSSEENQSLQGHVIPEKKERKIENSEDTEPGKTTSTAESPPESAVWKRSYATELHQAEVLNCEQCDTVLRVYRTGAHLCPSCGVKFLVKKDGSTSFFEKL